MPVRVRCSNPQCAQEARVPEKAVGKSVRCRACGTTFVLRPAEETTDGAAEVSLSVLKDGPPPAPTPPPSPAGPVVAPGSLIGRFEVRERVGAGAFGTVYRAFDPQLQREVAVKVPRPDVLNNPRRVERFLREARAAARLRHPNIVPVFDAGQAGSLPYIATAFVKGEPLSDAIPDGGMDPKRAATIVRALAEGLAYAHREGVVHRDVKPANVMLDDTGAPLLMDFGLAAQVDAGEEFRLPEQEADDRAAAHDDSRLTRAGTLMGTPSYMAPEVARGQKGEAQPAADQYALGVVLYELLTGRTPFEGPPAVVLHHAVTSDPPRPTEFRNDLPADLEAVCLKAMAKSPKGRYVTCQLLADDLRRWLDGEPVRARRVGAFERARRWVRTEPKLALTGGALAAAVLVAVGLAALLVTNAALADRDAAASDRDRARRTADERQAQLDAEAAEHARTRGARLDDALALARARFGTGDGAGAWDALNGIPADRRGPAWDFLAAEVDGLPEFRRILPAPPTAALDFQADGRHLLQVAANGDLVVWDTRADRELSRFPHHRDGEEWFWHAAAISPNGDRVATFASPANPFGAGGPVMMPALPKGPRAEPRQPQVVVWDRQGKVVRMIPATDDPHRLALSPDGKRLAIAGGPRDKAQQLAVWDLEGGQQVPAMNKTLAPAAGPAFAMGFSPDGGLLAATTIQAGGEVRVWEVGTGAERLVIQDQTAVITHLAFSPDGTRLAAAGGGGRLDGPEIEVTEYQPATRTGTKLVEADGKQKEVQYQYTVMVPVKAKRVGFEYRGARTARRQVCTVEKRSKMVYEQVMKQVPATTYETVTETVTRDGKTETIQRQVPRTVMRVVCEPVAKTVEYTVPVTRTVSTLAYDFDPLVRVWAVDGGALQMRVVESGPVTALAWRPDGQVLATATDRNDPCAGGDDCAGGGPAGFSTPALPPPATNVSDARDAARLLAVLLGTGFGYYGGPAVEAQTDRADVKLWDPAAGNRLVTLSTPAGPVTAVALSPDGRQVAAGSSGPLGVTLWGTQSRLLVMNGRGDAPVNDLVFSPDGSRLAAHTGCAGAVRLWDPLAGRPVARLDGAGPGIRFLPNQRLVADRPEPPMFGGYFGAGPITNLGRWSAEDGQPEGHPGDATGVVAYSPDGGRFVAGGTPGMDLVVRDGRTGDRVCALEQSAAVPGLKRVQVSKDGSRVAGLSWDEAILWDGATGKVLARRPDAVEADLSPDGRRWAVATRPPALPVMMPPPPAPAPKPLPEPPKADARPPGPSALLFPPLPTGPRAPEPPKAPPPARPMPAGPAVLPAAPPKPPALTVLDGDGKELARLPQAEPAYTSLAFDPTGRSLIGVTAGDEVQVWTLATAKLVARYRTGYPRVAVSPDGRFLAMVRPVPLIPMAPPGPKADGPARPLPAMDLTAGEPPFPPSDPGPGTRRTVWVAVIDLATGRLVWNAPVLATAHGGPAFSADGSRLALGYADGKAGYVQVWDTGRTGGEPFQARTVARFPGHRGPVAAVAFSPDGTRLASGGDDRMVKVWPLPAAGQVGPGGDQATGPKVMFPAAE